jgi:hypothetical protein
VNESLSPDTRHYHGGRWHDHEGGSVAHDHGPRLNDPPRSRSGGNGASAAFCFGTVLAFFGGLALLWQSGNHSACGSVLVQAASQSQCQEDSAIWTLGVIGLAIGIVLLIVGAILRGRE